MTPPRSFLKAALVAGLIAGGATAGFHLVITERLLDRAVQLEHGERHTRGAGAETPLVGRRAQRLGLVVGLLAYGVGWGLLFGVAYTVIASTRPPTAAPPRGWPLALLTGWAVAIVPFLKYPANPPGVHGTMEVSRRQILYLAFVVLSALTVGAAVAVRRSLRERCSAAVSLAAAVAVYVVCALALYRGLPNAETAGTVPADLIGSFRMASLAGLAFFWVVLGAAFEWLTRRRAFTEARAR